MGFAGNKLLGVRFTDVQTAAEVTADGPTHALGTRVSDNLGNEFVYVKAASAIVATDIIGVTDDYVVTVDGPMAWGVAISSIASGGAGWVQVKGIVNAAVAAATAKDDLLSRLVASAQLQIVVAVGVAMGDTAAFALALEADTANVASVYIF
jgi:hypothetical protein